MAIFCAHLTKNIKKAYFSKSKAFFVNRVAFCGKILPIHSDRLRLEKSKEEK